MTGPAAGVPLIGTIPLFPADYTSSAIYLAGGNATPSAQMAALAVDFFEAESTSIVSADNPGADGSGASLFASL